MPCNYKLNEDRFKMPNTLIKKYQLVLCDEAGNKKILDISNNHRRLVWHNIDMNISSAKLIPLETWGADKFNVFSFELM